MHKNFWVEADEIASLPLVVRNDRGGTLGSGFLFYN
jgi:hypothetical protein